MDDKHTKMFQLEKAEQFQQFFVLFSAWPVQVLVIFCVNFIQIIYISMMIFKSMFWRK